MRCMCMYLKIQKVVQVLYKLYYKVRTMVVGSTAVHCRTTYYVVEYYVVE